MAIWFRELDGFPKETKSVEGFTATRKLIVKWNDRKLLRNQLLTWPRQLYPYGDSFNARVDSVAIEGFGKQAQDNLGVDLAWYEYALMTVKYKSPQLGDEQENPNAPSDETQNVSEEIQPIIETIPLDDKDFEWATADGLGSKKLKPEEAPVWPVARMKYSITRHNLLSEPAELTSFMGTVNSTTIRPILLKTITFPPRTLMYQPAKVALSWNTNPVTGVLQLKFNITYNFSYRQETWWKFWRAAVQGYDTMNAKATGTQYKSPPEVDYSVILPAGST